MVQSFRRLDGGSVRQGRALTQRRVERRERPAYALEEAFVRNLVEDINLQGPCCFRFAIRLNPAKVFPDNGVVGFHGAERRPLAHPSRVGRNRERLAASA